MSEKVSQEHGMCTMGKTTIKNKENKGKDYYKGIRRSQWIKKIQKPCDRGQRGPRSPFWQRLQH